MAPRHGTGAGSCLSLPRGSPEALPPLPAGPQLQERRCFLCRRCPSSFPTFPTSLLGTGGCGCGEGAAGTQRGPPGSLRAIGGSAPSPGCVGGCWRCLTPVGDGQGETRRRKLWMCPGADAVAFPDSWGGCQGLSPPGGTCCPPLHIPGACNAQRKPKKPAVGGMEDGNAGDPLSRLSSCGSKAIGGPSLPCSPPSTRRCPASALLMGGL